MFVLCVYVYFIVYFFWFDNVDVNVIFNVVFIG